MYCLLMLKLYLINLGSLKDVKIFDVLICLIFFLFVIINFLIFVDGLRNLFLIMMGLDN